MQRTAPPRRAGGSGPPRQRAQHRALPTRREIARRRAVLGLLTVVVLAVVAVTFLPGAKGTASSSPKIHLLKGKVLGASVPGTPAASSQPPSTSPSGRSKGRPASATTTTAPPTTTTTVDPGTLPQTNQLPSPTDPAFLAKMQDLWQAVVTGNPQLALPAFFPLSAYVQIKAISDPAGDYQDRLIADYEQDIMTIHQELGAQAATAQLSGVDVPNQDAEWILPGVEYNSGSYWRVYGTQVNYTVGGQPGSFPIASLISWRGEWYVVHLLSIR